MPFVEDQDPLIRTLKRVAFHLKELDIPFALAGSLAVYARGGRPVATRTDRLGEGRARDRPLSVRPGVYGASGPTRCGVAGRDQFDDEPARQAQGGVSMKVDTHTESQLQRLLTEDDRLAEQGI